MTDEAALRAALDAIVERHGVPEVLVYNAALIQGDAIGDLTARSTSRRGRSTWSARSRPSPTRPAHGRAGGGTIVLTGGMPEPVPDVTSLSLGKAGVRALTELLRNAVRPRASTSRR